MVRKFSLWLREWAVTLQIKFFEPSLYRDLTTPFDYDMYEEVERPSWTRGDGV